MSIPCNSFIKDCARLPLTKPLPLGKTSKITNLPYVTCATCNCEEGDFNIGDFGCKYDSTGKPLSSDKQPESCGF